MGSAGRVYQRAPWQGVKFTVDYSSFWQVANRLKRQLSILWWSWIPVGIIAVVVWVKVLNLKPSVFFCIALLGTFMYLNYKIATKLESLICPKCGCTAFQGGGGKLVGLQCRVCGLTENET